MGGPCTKGGYEDLTNFCQHARLYIASDMANGGFDMDDWTCETFKETDIELQYHRLFADPPTLRDALAGRLDVRRREYEYARHNNDRDSMDAGPLGSVADGGEITR